MKKFISMLLCLAMVLSLCAVTFAAEATSATISFDDKANRTEFTTEKQVWVQNGITVTNDKAASASDVADYAKPARFYKNSKLTIAYPGMIAIEFDCNSTTYATALKNSITTGTVTVNGKVVGVTLDAAADSYVIEALSGGQVRIDKITVYAGSAPVIPEQPEQPEQTQDPAADSKLTVKEALDLGASKEHDSYTTNKYYVTGVITEVYNTQYGNMKIADADGNILTIYGTYSADGSTRYDAMDVKPVAGDTVTIYGIIGQYNGTPQIKNGWITEHTVANPGTPEQPEQPEQPETPTAPTYATEITVGTAYMLGMYSTSKSATYYFTGKMSGYYGATETTVDTAVSVYVEAATGGYYLYFVDANGAKQYINLVASGAHRNFTFATTATSVFTWDAEKDALYTEVEGENCYMGTYGTYVTVGVLQTSKLKDTDYIARLYTLNGSETPDTPDVPDVPEEPEQPEQPSGNRADFETLNSEGTGQYTQSFTTANGWTTVNSAIQVGGPSVANPAFPVVGADNTHKAVCLNGKTSAVGKLTSPTLTGGISKLTMDYTKMFTDTLLSVTITITDLSNGKTYTKTVSREEDKNTKYVVWTDEWVLETPITGDFTIEVVNNCPSSVDGNKDRFTILSLAWEGAHAHDYKVTTTADCKTDGVTTYTCDCGHTYTEETPAWGHIDENLDIDCDREGCTSKVVPAADSLLSNFTANCLGSKVSTDNKYYVQGTIVEVLDAKNGIFLIDDGTGERFYFRLPVNADGASHASWAIKLTLGDKVKVYGKINKFSTSTAPNGQFWPAIQGGVVTVLEQHAHDFTYSPADCRNPAACVCGQTYGAPRGCVDADENNICDDCGKNTKYAYEYIEIRTDNNSGVHDATALTYTWSNGNFVVQVAKASGGNLYVTSNNHMRLYKNNQLVLTNKNGLTVKTIIVYLTNATQVSNFEKMLTGYTYTKNETDFTITIEVDSFETLTLINSGSTTQIKGVEFGYERHDTVDKAAADVVVAQINAIGTVTLDSRATIEAVRAAYEALTDAQKALVGNLATLEAAEEALQALQQQADKEAADKKAAGVVVALIEEIGTVTKDSKAAIEAARAAYDALTDAQKALVENYETLTKAEEAFKGIANTGDNTMMFVAMAILSMTAVVALVSKKRAF